MYPVANRARTCPSKASVKQARKTHFFPAVVSGFVDQGEIMGIFPSSATCAAGVPPPAGLRPPIRDPLFSGGEPFKTPAGLRCGSLAVFHDEPEPIRLPGDLHAAGFVDLGDGHLGRVLARGADGGNVAAELGDHSDREVGKLLRSAGPEERHAREQEKKESEMSSHRSVLPRDERYVIREVESRPPIRCRTCFSRPSSSLPSAT